MDTHKKLEIDWIARMLWAEHKFDGVPLKEGMRRVRGRADEFFRIAEENHRNFPSLNTRPVYSLIRAAIGYGDLDGFPMFLAADASRREWRLARRVDMTDALFVQALEFVFNELADEKAAA